MEKHTAFANQVAGRGYGKVGRLINELARHNSLLEGYMLAASEDDATIKELRAQRLSRDELLMLERRVNAQLGDELNEAEDKLNSIIEALPDLYSLKPDVYTFDREELNTLLGIQPERNKPQIIEINDCGTNPKIKTTEKELVKMLLNTLYGRFQPPGVFYTCLDHYHYAPEA